MRLQKYLSMCGVASRRKSEDLIKQGKVKVNDKIITEMGFDISEDDSVIFNGKIIKPSEFVYIVMNKPAKVLCSHADTKNRKKIYDLIREPHSKLFSLGRLDYYSAGIIIITNDGDFAQSIIHPSNNISKEYHVETTLDIPEKLIENFKKGIYIDSHIYKAVKINKISSRILTILLNEGKNREIRNVFDFFNIKIRMLERTAIGNLRLENLRIKEGEYIYLSLENIKKLILNI
jgi:23S rRNA pseudouridine2605 synthase